MRKYITILSLLFAVFGASTAWAHAHLDHASPTIGSTVETAPREVALWFTENLEPAFSTVHVMDASGARVDQGKAQVSSNTMRVGLTALAPGTYSVRWHAVSVDTHTTEGSFTFHVGAP